MVYSRRFSSWVSSSFLRTQSSCTTNRVPSVAASSSARRPWRCLGLVSQYLCSNRSLATRHVAFIWVSIKRATTLDSVRRSASDNSHICGLVRTQPHQGADHGVRADPETAQQHRGQHRVVARGESHLHTVGVIGSSPIAPTISQTSHVALVRRKRSGVLFSRKTREVFNKCSSGSRKSVNT
jgi:hypothetical protein